jgi:chemotaxis protein CheX
MMPITETLDLTPAVRHFASGLAGGLKDVFAKMFNEQAELVPHIGAPGRRHVSSIIAFAGQVSGFLCIHMEPEVACRIAEGLLDTKFDHVEDEVRDAVGELANMVAGKLKSHLSQRRECFRISIPTVIEGTDYSTYAPAQAQNLFFGVAAGKYRFSIQLALEPKGTETEDSPYSKTPSRR